MSFDLYKVYKGEYNTDNTTGMSNEALQALIDLLENVTADTTEYHRKLYDMLRTCEDRREELIEDDKWDVEED